MKIKKTIIYFALFFIFIGTLTFFPYTKTKTIIQEEPYEIKKLYCSDENQECYFIDTKGDLYNISLLDSFSKPTKIKGISNVKSFSIAKGYYGAVTEDGSLFMWINPKSKYKDWIPFKNLFRSVPTLI